MVATDAHDPLRALGFALAATASRKEVGKKVETMLRPKDLPVGNGRSVLVSEWSALRSEEKVRELVRHRGSRWRREGGKRTQSDRRRGGQAGPGQARSARQSWG